MLGIPPWNAAEPASLIVTRLRATITQPQLVLINLEAMYNHVRGLSRDLRACNWGILTSIIG